jgi:hypothetical protein
MCIGTFGCNLIIVVDDTGPDGGEGKEDADEGEGLGSEFRDMVVELEDAEDS